MFDLAYELRKCTECSCSRCVLNGTKDCYVEVAIKELNRYEQAMDAITKSKDEANSDAYLYKDGDDPDSVRAAYYSKNF